MLCPAFHINSYILTFKNGVSFDPLLRKEKDAEVMVDLFALAISPRTAAAP